MMADNDVKALSIGTDHGHRHNLDSLGKVVAMPVKENGRKTISTICLDADFSYHTAGGCAEAVKRSLEPLLDPFDSSADDNADEGNDKPVIETIVGDNGGGAKVTRLHSALKDNEVMDSDSVSTNCTLHALNKPFERAVQAAFGSPGLGNNNASQYLFLFATIMKQCVSDVERNVVDKWWKQTMNKMLLKGREWSEEAQRIMKQAITALLDDLDNMTPEELVNAFQ